MVDDEAAGISDDLAGSGGWSSGPVGYFRDHPARFFGALGTIVFVLGWVGVIYIALVRNDGVPDESWYRLQVLVSMGMGVTTASAILWGISAYIWVHLLPEASETAT